MKFSNTLLQKNPSTIVFIFMASLFFFATACKKKDKENDANNSTLSITGIQLQDVSAATSKIVGELIYEVTLPVSGSLTKTTVKEYRTEFDIAGANYSSQVSFYLPENVKTVKASCEIRILGGTAEKLEVGSLKLVTKTEQHLYVDTIRGDFRSDFYQVGPYLAIYN